MLTTTPGTGSEQAIMKVLAFLDSQGIRIPFPLPCNDEIGTQFGEFRLRSLVLRVETYPKDEERNVGVYVSELIGELKDFPGICFAGVCCVKDGWSIHAGSDAPKDSFGNFRAHCKPKGDVPAFIGIETNEVEMWLNHLIEGFRSYHKA